MKFRVEREALADAVTWAARSLSTRPTMPVLGGLLLPSTGEQLSVSGFDLEASTEVDLEVSAGADGQALVSGRLLADITKALPPHPVDVTVDGSRLSIVCGAARFTLPTMPVEDYPRLPNMPTTAGTVASAEFATPSPGRRRRRPRRHAADADRRPARDRRHPAHPRRHRPLPAGRARAGLEPGEPVRRAGQVLVPARTLDDAAKSLSHSDSMTIALAGRRRPARASSASPASTNGRASRATTRLLDATFPAYRSLLPNEWSSSAEITVGPLVEAVRRVALVADRSTPVRLEFSDGTLALSRRRRGRGARRGEARDRLRRRRDHDRVQPAVPARRPGRADLADARGCCSPRPTSRSCCARTAPVRRRRRVHLRDDAGPAAGLSRRSMRAHVRPASLGHRLPQLDRRGRRVRARPVRAGRRERAGQDEPDRGARATSPRSAATGCRPTRRWCGPAPSAPSCAARSSPTAASCGSSSRSRRAGRTGRGSTAHRCRGCATCSACCAGCCSRRRTSPSSAATRASGAGSWTSWSSPARRGWPPSAPTTSGCSSSAPRC